MTEDWYNGGIENLVTGDDKKKLTIEDLLEKFTTASHDMLSDATILGD